MAAPVPLHFIINVNKTHVHTWIRLDECVLIIMSCFGDDSIKVSNMAAPIKSGYMLRYKRRIFGKDWREQYVTLFSDSSLIWYKDRNSNEHEGGIRIRDAPELMAFGEFTSNVPNRPELPSGYTPTTLIVFGTRGRETIYWFLCKYELEIQEWIAAIVGTLPPPPQPPQPPTNPSAPTEQEQMQGINVTPVHPPAMPNTIQPPYQNVMPVQYQGPQRFPAQPVAYTPLQPGYPSGPAPSNTTVVVQDRQNNTGDFATGMLLGGAMGAMWGHGIGWGGGLGHGGGGYSNTDIHIHNNYDIDNHIQNSVQNDTSNVFQDDTTVFGGGDFDTDDFDGGGDFDGGDW